MASYSGPYSYNVSGMMNYVVILHTYIIGHYNPSVRIIDLVSHTTYIVCVNFYNLKFKVDSELQDF